MPEFGLSASPRKRMGLTATRVRIPSSPVFDSYKLVLFYICEFRLIYIMIKYRNDRRRNNYEYMAKIRKRTGGLLYRR